MQGLTFSLNKNWKKKNPKVVSDQVVFLLEEVVEWLSRTGTVQPLVPAEVCVEMLWFHPARVALPQPHGCSWVFVPLPLPENPGAAKPCQAWCIGSSCLLISRED